MNEQAEALYYGGTHQMVLVYGALIVAMAATVVWCFTTLTGPFKWTGEDGAPKDKRPAGVFIVLLLAAGLFWAVAKQGFYDRLRQYGRNTTGCVSDTTQYRVKGILHHRIAYQYRVDGRTLVGHTVNPDEEALKAAVSAGQCFLVIYNTQDPSESILDISTPKAADSATAGPKQ